MWKEFKQFLMRGNILELATAFIIGSAFGKIVTSLIDDIIMPPIGLLLGGVDFKNMFINLSGTAYDSLKAAQDAGAPTINYGVFINTVLQFLIIALVIFVVMRQVSKFQKPAEAPETTKLCTFCKSTIAKDATRCPYCTSQL